MREILFRGKRVDNGEWVYGLICRVGKIYLDLDDSNLKFLHQKYL